jgi:hypothetical protein
LGNKAGSKKSGKEFGPKTAFLDGLQQAYASGSLKLIKRIHALLALAQAKASVTWRRCCLSVSKPYVITGAIHHSGSHINREDRWNCTDHRGDNTTRIIDDAPEMLI